MAITLDYVDAANGNDYIGATFNDGAFANATLTLTKAGAFTDTLVGHKLWLDDNGSGEVTTGEYYVTNVAGVPNSVVLNADIRSGANDPTDVVCVQAAGTAVLPWRSLQGAFDLCTRNAADGNQINLLAGTAQVNLAALDLTDFVVGGTLLASRPLIVRGYTLAANDGGIGEVDCGGATMWTVATYDNICLVDLEIHTFGDNHGVQLDNHCFLLSCEVHCGASAPADKYLIVVTGTTSTCSIAHCYIHGLGTGAARGISMATGSCVGNYIECGTAATAVGIWGSTSFFINNIVLCGAVGQRGIQATQAAGGLLMGNIAYNTTAGTDYGIGSAGYPSPLNNIVVGWNGVGGEGISVNNQYLYGFNAFWQNTANYSIADMTFIDETANDVALAADPFTNAAAGDFSLTAAARAALADKGFPVSYYGAHANTVSHLNIGPIQYPLTTTNLLRGKLGS